MKENENQEATGQNPQLNDSSNDKPAKEPRKLLFDLFVNRYFSRLFELRILNIWTAFLSQDFTE